MLANRKENFLFFLLIGIKLISLANGLYYQESQVNKNENSSVIENLRILISDSETKNKFPSEFSIEFDEFNAHFNIKFIKQSKHDPSYPIGSSDIYVIDEKTGQPVLYQDNEKTEDYELYLEVESTGHAILIENKDSSNKNSYPFRLIATVHQYHNETNQVFDIMPIKKANKYKKRSLNDEKSHHMVFKRNALNDLPKDSFQDLADYQVIGDLDQKIQEKANSAQAKGSPRAVNGQPLQLTIEHLVVTELSVYQLFQKFFGVTDQTLTFQYMRIYFSHSMNAANLRYQNSLANDPDMRATLKLTNFLFLINTADIQWANPSVVGDPSYPTYNNKEVIVTTKTINALANYLNSKTFPFSFDDATGFFNKDLWGDTFDAPTTRTQVAGFGNIGTFCSQYKYSIVEEFGGFQNILALTHEIGHNFGAIHDGLNACPLADNYIMAPGPQQSNLVNMFKFSSCSIAAFKSTVLTNNAQINPAFSCLTDTSATPAPIETTYAATRYPGQFFSVHDQCKMQFGNESSSCQEYVSGICTTLSCRTSTGCLGYNGGAAEGTTCASGKICIQGVCTSSPVAPTGDCLVADDVVRSSVLGTLFVNFFGFSLPNAVMNCQEVIDYATNNRNFPLGLMCQNPYFSAPCCNACKKYSLLTCVDYVSLCTNQQYCTQAGATISYSVALLCKKTCNQCSGQTSCSDIYQNCAAYASQCNGGFIQGIPYATLCPRQCGTCSSAALTCASASGYCLNGGSCISSNVSPTFQFACVCQAGYSGERCEIKMPCSPNPCNTGTCQQFGSLGYFCVCPAGCTGYNCESCGQVTTTTTVANPTTTSSTTKTSTTTTASPSTSSASTASVSTSSASTASVSTSSASTASVSTSSASTASVSTSSSSIASTSASGCVNTIDDSTCNYYASLNLNLCNINSYYKNQLLSDVCKKSCNKCGGSSQTTTPSNVITTTASFVCKNSGADNVCDTFAALGYCNVNAFYTGVPFVTACQRSCNKCGSSQTTTKTTTVAPTCTDSQTSCSFWANYCYLLANQNPHPCRRTCKLC